MPAKKPSRTDCCRWLNLQGEDQAKLASLHKDYETRCVAGGNKGTANFGFWLKDNHPMVFNRTYDWFVKHPELLKLIYDTEEDPSVPPADIPGR